MRIMLLTILPSSVSRIEKSAESGLIKFSLNLHDIFVGDGKDSAWHAIITVSPRVAHFHLSAMITGDPCLCIVADEEIEENPGTDASQE